MAEVRFGLTTHELWQDWCALQTSYDWAPDATGMCGCLPNWGGAFTTEGCSQEHPQTGQVVERSCMQVSFCVASFGPCQCTASGCRANRDPNVFFELARSGDVLTGSVSSMFGSSGVELTRQ